jgi:hypothetical protein
MFDRLLKNENPLIRLGFASLVVFGGLYFLSSIGIMSTRFARYLSLIAFAWFILRNGKVISQKLQVS